MPAGLSPVPAAEAEERGTVSPALRCRREPVPEKGPLLSLLICMMVAARLLLHG